MAAMKASDLYLSAGQSPRYRVLGEVVPSDDPPLDESYMASLVFSLLDEKARHVFEETGDYDFAYEEPGVSRFRVNLFRQRQGMGAVFRFITSQPPPLDSLQLPPIVKEFLHLEQGLVLVTGPTGSGKSTTLASLVTAMADLRRLHVLTVEDPIEYVLTSERSLITQREVGFHTPSFAQALRDALREDIDVLMVGEMRDLDTVSLALKAAEMGLLVLATLHTPTAVRAINRMIDIFPTEAQEQVRLLLADCLRAVVAQQLVRRADGQGRVACAEILLSSPSLSHTIREGKVQQVFSMMQTGREAGMVTMDQSLVNLFRQGIITEGEAFSRAHDPGYLLSQGLRMPTQLAELLVAEMAAEEAETAALRKPEPARPEPGGNRAGPPTRSEAPRPDPPGGIPRLRKDGAPELRKEPPG
jgi:twitching motility protein PilT